MRWYRKAAEQGHPIAQYRLAVGYRYGGRGVEPNLSEAIKWFRKAAENGNIDAQWSLGVTYYYTKKDYIKAIKWYRKAMEQRNKKAQNFLTRNKSFLSTIQKLATGENIDAQYIIKQYNNWEEEDRIKRIDDAKKQGLRLSEDGRVAMYFDGKENCSIPEGVIEIRDGAFSQRNLKRITIPSSVRKIGDYAFAHCPQLEKVTIFVGTKEIGAYAFVACPQLRYIMIPHSVKKIGKCAFADCTSLKEIRIPYSCNYYIDKKSNAFPRTQTFPANCKIKKY